MVYSLGIMQGRLTPSRGRGIQFFPFDTWENEFRDAVKIGLNEIEFIFDFDRYSENPLWSDLGIVRINNLILETGIKVNHICADFFMRRPFFRVDTAIRMENCEILKQLIQSATQIGARTIEIPLVDNSSIKTKAEEDVLIESLRNILPFAEDYDLTITLETDLPPQSFLSLLQKINHPLVKANYDSGNSSGLGYDPREEVTTLGTRIHNIHIKDRILGGSTVALGTGSVDFERFFQALKETCYGGSFILQAARGVDGDESKTIQHYMDFVSTYIQKYLV